MKNDWSPRSLERLLRCVLPNSRVEDVLGDLREAHAVWVHRFGARRARLRLWREVLALVAWRLAGRLMGRLVRAKGSPPRGIDGNLQTGGGMGMG